MLDNPYIHFFKNIINNLKLLPEFISKFARYKEGVRLGNAA